jgi:hypothetical protein
MKNRIVWIFDSAEPVEELPRENQQQVKDDTSLTELPWALFGAIGAQQKAELQRSYQLASLRARAEAEKKQQEALRFERLLADLEAQDSAQ